MGRFWLVVCVAGGIVGSAAWGGAEQLGGYVDSCNRCHGDAARMQALGYPHFVVNRAEVARQTGMPAGCPDCHLGNPDAAAKDEAHKGLKRLLVVRKKGLVAEPADRKAPLMVTAGPVQRLKFQVMKDGKPVVDPTVNTVLYHDKLPETLTQDFATMEKTCGRCHSGQVAQFRTTPMGRNAKQSQYVSWSEPARGPHNCGVWSVANYKGIAAATAVPFSQAQSDLNQRTCNNCHVGCLDCHYYPTLPDRKEPRSGMHAFRKTPPPESCYGGGRGQFCHAGPEDRRRGAGYFAGPFSFPEGLAPDIHRTKGVGCLDCHSSNRDDASLPHGMVRRQATCTSCHAEIVKSHAASQHRTLSCEACHIGAAGGYQATFWGPGMLAGSTTPYYKYKDYYGIMSEPILIRDQRGRWIPVKPFPMAVMNQKGGGFTPGLKWRYPLTLADAERTDDAWGFVGLVDGLPENNKALLWVQMDKLSHRYGASRSCASCHGSAGGEQRRQVSWDFGDNGALPFSGSHLVIANREGLAIREMKAKDAIEADKGIAVSSLAPWYFLKDRWFVPGDFSLPAVPYRQGAASAAEELSAARAKGLVHR